MQTDQYQLKHDEAGLRPDENKSVPDTFRTFNDKLYQNTAL
jgi:hypothetical protein